MSHLLPAAPADSLVGQRRPGEDLTSPHRKKQWKADTTGKWTGAGSASGSGQPTTHQETWGEDEGEGDKDKGKDDKGGDKDKRKKQQQQKKTGKKQQGHLEDSDMHELVKLLTKCAVQTQSRLRTIENLTYDTWMVATEHKLIEKATEQGKAYHHMAKEHRDKALEAGDIPGDHGRGPPHLYIWGGVLQGLLDEGDRIGAKNKKDLETYLAKWNTMDRTAQCDDIRYCQISPTYHDTMKRLTVALAESSQVKEPLYSALAQLGATRKFGRAPPGALERSLATWVRHL